LWGSIDEIENDVYFLLKNNLLKDISENTKSKLIQRGYLTEFTIEKEANIVKNIIMKYYAKHLEREGGSYIIILSYNCNFRCPYCFEKQIQRKGLEYLKNKMDFDMINYLWNFIEKNPPKRKSVTLYGGEPFMRENKEELKYLINKLSDKYKLKFISNGFEIAEFLDLLNESNTEFVQISLDGPRVFHNKTRRSCMGDESFDIIMNNIISLIAKKISVYLRVNCTIDNINYLKELNETLKNYPFYYNNLFSISYSPIIDFLNKKKTKTLEMSNFIEKIESLNNYGKSHGFIEGIYIHNHLRFFFQNSLIYKEPLIIQPLACNTYSNSYVLDPFGKIYPCWDVVDDAEHCIGTFYPEITENKQAISIWRNRESIIFEKCIQCPYVLHCGGGCMVKAKLKKGKLDDVYCDSFAEIFEIHFLNEYNKLIIK
jgi:uncharacterized protein